MSLYVKQLVACLVCFWFLATASLVLLFLIGGWSSEDSNMLALACGIAIGFAIITYSNIVYEDPLQPEAF